MTVVNPESANAFIPISVTELGIVIDVKPVHQANALELILVTCEVGSNVTDVKPEEENALEPIVVTA